MSNKLSITISDQGLRLEREYSIRMLVKEFLELNYELKYHNHPTYIFQVGEGKIKIQDHFFSKFQQSADYLKEEHIPMEIDLLDMDEWQIEQLPIIFGTNQLQIQENEIKCEADLFASTFFMLSRWEEFANPKKDEHDRFPGNESLAYKQEFLNRPLVNEYADMLWQMLRKMGYKGKRKSRKFMIKPTHDIDDLVYWTETNKKRRFLNLAGDIVKRGNINMARQRWKSYAETQKDIRKDPYYTYDHLMDQAEKEGVKARFYFMSGGNSAYDRAYDLTSDLFKKITNGIKEQSHAIGFHASYNTYQTPDLFNKEKYRLEQAIDMEITEVRQHYLRFENSTTMHIWEQAGLKWDSTLYYSGFPGFRCGSCYPFPLFDIYKRKETGITERNLLAMDCCFENMSADQAVELISEIKQQTKKHKGDFVFLLHNSSYAWLNNYPNFSVIEKVFYDL